ncbi:hypothetical protein EV363DRAFT_1308591 [Boletus edulis]|uniref:Uncharacterized protein n=1 Tax=Boletus edulis BED1 TaxID=1328754 RepID=A0AAD4C6B4_BOLED|nr:hypothetical protein EV363DRAFT_1308591 [Boletus edulis]KAF8449030.1 hypothetical protein L210DRAFT_3523742 [Boletus edulis BED1]
MRRTSVITTTSTVTVVIVTSKITASIFVMRTSVIVKFSWASTMVTGSSTPVVSAVAVSAPVAIPIPIPVVTVSVVSIIMPPTLAVLAVPTVDAVA